MFALNTKRKFPKNIGGIQLYKVLVLLYCYGKIFSLGTENVLLKNIYKNYFWPFSREKKETSVATWL